MFRLDGKVALVTGGTSGLGLATAEAFARAGARVAVSARGAARAEERLAALRDVGDVLYVRADVSHEADVEAMVERAAAWGGRLDVLVNSAGIIRRRPVVEESAEGWDDVFATNVRGVFLCCRAAIPRMAARGGGAIVNVASLNAVRTPPSTPAYNASKAAVVNLTRTLALAHGPQGIRVNAVLPGFVPTEMNRAMREALSEEDRARSVERIPLRRWGRPEDIAYAILFLASDEAGWITGTMLEVDGGVGL